MQARRGGGFVARTLSQPGTREMWVVNATFRPFHPWQRPGTHGAGGWVSLGSGLNDTEKFQVTGIQSSDRPSRSQLLYRLRYPDRQSSV
jgi:hypothetical protein